MPTPVAAFFEQQPVAPPPSTYITRRSGSVTDLTVAATTLTLTKPAGTVNGDVLIAVITWDPSITPSGFQETGFQNTGFQTGGSQTAVSVTNPAGWVQLGTDRQIGSSLAQRVLRRVASGEPASYGWNFSSATICSGLMNAYSGVNTTTPEDAVTTQTNAPGAGAVTFTAAGQARQGNSGDFTPGLPVGWAANDIFVLVATCADNVVLSLPAGWTKRVEVNNGAAMRLTIAWRRAVAGDTDPLVTHTAGADYRARIAGFRGAVTTGDPFDVVGSQANAASQTITAPAITPPNAGDLILFIGGASNGTSNPTDGTSFSGYSGTNPVFTEAMDNAYSGLVGNPELFLAYGTKTDTTTTAARTATGDLVGPNVGALLAMRPSGSTTYTFPAVTPVTDGAWHLATVSNDGASNTFTTPTSYAADNASGTSGLSDAVFHRKITPPAAVSGVTTVGSVSTNAITTSVVLRPAVPGGGAPPPPPPPAQTPAITATPSSINSGETTTITGQAFPANSPVAIHVGSGDFVATSAANGSFSAVIDIESQTTGPQVVTATSGTVSATTRVFVTFVAPPPPPPPPPGPPPTGTYKSASYQPPLKNTATNLGGEIYMSPGQTITGGYMDCQGRSWGIHMADDCTIDGVEFYNTGTGYGAAVEMNNASRARLINCKFRNLGADGAMCNTDGGNGQSDNLIQDNLFDMRGTPNGDALHLKGTNGNWQGGSWIPANQRNYRHKVIGNVALGRDHEFSYELQDGQVDLVCQNNYAEQTYSLVGNIGSSQLGGSGIVDVRGNYVSAGFWGIEYGNSRGGVLKSNTFDGSSKPYALTGNTDQQNANNTFGPDTFINGSTGLVDLQWDGGGNTVNAPDHL